MQEIFEVTPRLQVEDSGDTVKLSSIAPHGGVLFKKWFNIFKTDVQDGLKLGQNIKVKIVAKTRNLSGVIGTNGKSYITKYDKVAWVYLPKNPDNETRQLIESYITSVDDDGNYPITYKGQTYLAAASAVGASLIPRVKKASKKKL